ncbi:MAG: HlyD family secretion protein [endosymbiont of Galathealinum brachiosum]|uniref:HlyD family secretion protein n=1 Tax=endosymbiont of Galathealinum brachiosum TaxID=2200906 RepID=A0A370D955_9GAMM|nr:MAG: HlyD family secretion protein [endosymbiont of Galathealinum brachiosum]
MKINLKKYPALFIIIGIGIVIAFILVKSKNPMQHEAATMPSKAVDIITARNIPFRSRITAYGNVEPAITLNGMAEVSGKVSYVHPNLKSGEAIPAGTLVVRIEAKDYTVSLKQTEADLRASRSALKELTEDEKSTKRSLVLAKKNLKVGEAEYTRIEKIWKQRVISKSTLDAEEQKVLQLRQQVEELQGKINSYDSRKQSVKSQIIRAEQEVKNRQTILGRTEVTLPFDARIGTVNIEKNEFVSVGSVLFEAIDLKGVEINAHLPMDSMRKLVTHLQDTPLAGQQIAHGGRINDSLGLVATARLVNGMPGAVWEAHVLRLSDSIDPTRQTLGIVVGVDDPYEKIIPGIRPPLIKGMYTAVDIFAPVHSAMVIPRKAVHQGRVYIANTDNTLSIRDIDIRLIQAELVVVSNGLEEGEQVIITDMIPVIEGMPLQVNIATDFEKEMKLRASGEQLRLAQ